jgi:hypothetical protein
MPRLEQVVIANRDVQTSNVAIYRKDLPKAGYYSALDVGIRIQNGATSSRGLDLLDIIKHLSLVFNGNDYRFHMSGQDMFRYQWLKRGSPRPYIWTEIGSGYPVVWFRMYFGRSLGDTLYGLNLAKYNSVQLQVDYDAVTAWGAAAATTFTTGTFEITTIAHQFPIERPPVFRGMMGVREFYACTSVASGDIVQNLPSARPIVGMYIAAREDNVAEATDITDVKLGRDNFKTTWLNNKWYNLKLEQNEQLDETTEAFLLYLGNAMTLDTHLDNIKMVSMNPRTFTLAVA